MTQFNATYVRTGSTEIRTKWILLKDQDVCAFLRAAIKYIHNYPPFTTERTESPRVEVSCPESHHSFMDPGFKSRPVHVLATH